MKHKFKISVVLTLILALSHLSAHAQSKLRIHGGFGLPEAAYVGISWDLGKYIIEGSVGMFPENAIMFNSGILLHFGKGSTFYDRGKFLFRAEFTYGQEENRRYKHRYAFVPLRLGRSIEISRRFGLNIEAGLMIITIQESMNKQIPNGQWSPGLNLTNGLLPSASIGLYYYLGG